MDVGYIASTGFGTVLVEMYITLLPIIVAGCLNMIWCRLPWPPRLRKPIDSGKNWGDGHRLLGDNKTWLGFLGMMLLGMICMIVWGSISTGSIYLTEHNYFYRYFANSLPYNTIVGLATGFAYALFELPNSFMKRRLRIEPGKRAKGRLSVLFVILDQADSVFGVTFVVALLCPMGLLFGLLYICVGTVTHILFNMLLFALHLRDNPF